MPHSENYSLCSFLSVSKINDPRTFHRFVISNRKRPCVWSRLNTAEIDPKLKSDRRSIFCTSFLCTTYSMHEKCGAPRYPDMSWRLVERACLRFNINNNDSTGRDRRWAAAVHYYLLTWWKTTISRFNVAHTFGKVVKKEHKGIGIFTFFY